MSIKKPLTPKGNQISFHQPHGIAKSSWSSFSCRKLLGHNGLLSNKLFSPSPASHKGQNGVALIIGGGRKYHGSAVLAVLAASRFVDLLYFYSPSKMPYFFVRKATPCVICISKNELGTHIKRADCILIGPGMDKTKQTKSLVRQVLSTKKSCILDATALRIVEKKYLHNKATLTPNVREFEFLFGEKPTKQSVSFCAKQYNCNILLKGKKDTIATSDGKLYIIKGGNAGMTKGGTGDTLAGLLCALLCKNKTLYALLAASCANKKAGEMLARKYGLNYSALDVANELPKTLNLK
ncbi:MAG: NAD(P)H-hydrate dehydratase [Candidatus Anstonellales archaeon]